MLHIPRRAATALAGTAVITVLLFSFKTPAELVGGTDGSTIAVVDGGRGPLASSAPRPTAAPNTGSGGAASTPAPNDTTTSVGNTAGLTEVTGPTVSTRFGPVQVKIEISGGKLSDIVAVQLPTHGRSGRISDYAEPQLHDEALTAQSASIDGVSGATYTSQAYEQSLQAALDQAGI